MEKWEVNYWRWMTARKEYSEKMAVWAVFFMQEGCWVLDSLWVTSEKAVRRGEEADNAGYSIEFRVEKMWVR